MPSVTGRGRPFPPNTCRSDVPTGQRLDEIVAERAGVTRARARSLIIAGRVRVDGRPLTKPGTAVRPSSKLDVERPHPYVSRGGEKLEGALRDFSLAVGGARCLDVGYGQLAFSLRGDPRVSVVERTNFRLLPDEAFGREFEVVTIDASFISVVTMIARARRFLAADGAIVALVKPQFEAGPQRLGGGGVVRDPAVHRAILGEVRTAVGERGLVAVAVTSSPLRGPAGNAEFFVLVREAGTPFDDPAAARLTGGG